jgi:hypothetical protein
VGKSEWNDWRRHLAMIVSNIDDNNRDLVYNSIRSMGDHLGRKFIETGFIFDRICINMLKSTNSYKRKSGGQSLLLFASRLLIRRI